MSEEFKVEIVNPEKSFFSKEDITEVVVPAFEGEMGILKDHISIISFLKPGIITIQSKSSEEKFFVEDGIRGNPDANDSYLMLCATYSYVLRGKSNSFGKRRNYLYGRKRGRAGRASF